MCLCCLSSFWITDSPVLSLFRKACFFLFIQPLISFVTFVVRIDYNVLLGHRAVNTGCYVVCYSNSSLIKLHCMEYGPISTHFSVLIASSVHTLTVLCSGLLDLNTALYEGIRCIVLGSELEREGASTLLNMQPLYFHNIYLGSYYFSGNTLQWDMNEEGTAG